MTTRREFLQWAAALGAAVPALGSVRALAQQRITQDDLLAFEPLGQVTLLHIADLHGQLTPLHLREPVAAFERRAGRAFLDAYAVPYGSPLGHALAGEDFLPLVRSYGRVGGIDRIATVVNAIRAERPDRTLLLDGGDAWQGSYAALETRGAAMVEAMNALGVDAMTGHGEFMLGRERVMELVEKFDGSFLADNVRDTEWNDEPFDGYGFFEVNGINIAVIGLAYAHTAAADARWIVPKLSFAVDPARLRTRVSELREQGAQLVVLLSHNGRAFDRRLAGLVPGIDVILSAHSHDALPAPDMVSNTLIVASGAHGKFVSRLDLEVKANRIAAHRYRLIPVLADVIAPDAEVTGVVARLRAPFDAAQKRVIGRTHSLLYRRDALESPVDNLILDALAEATNAEIALSPGFRWGATLLPGDITVKDVMSQVAIPYGATWRTQMSGEAIKAALEDAAETVFNPEPLNRWGRDLVRVGGLAFTLDPAQPAGQRIVDPVLVRNGQKLDASKGYTVAGWAGPDRGDGPAIADVVTGYIERKKIIRMQERRRVRLAG